MRILSDSQLSLFLDKVVVADSGCWLWTGYRDNKGYGRCKYVGVSERLVHRVSYIWFNGAIPAGMTVDHMCQVTSCLNPRHLRLMTALDNYRVARWSSPNRTHCPAGHVYDDANTYIHPPANGRGPRRGCRTCLREQKKAYKKRQRMSHV